MWVSQRVQVCLCWSFLPFLNFIFASKSLVCYADRTEVALPCFRFGLAIAKVVVGVWRVESMWQVHSTCNTEEVWQQNKMKIHKEKKQWGRRKCGNQRRSVEIEVWYARANTKGVIGSRTRLKDMQKLTKSVWWLCSVGVMTRLRRLGQRIEGTIRSSCIWHKLCKTVKFFITIKITTTYFLQHPLRWTVTLINNTNSWKLINL